MESVPHKTTATAREDALGELVKEDIDVLVPFFDVTRPKQQNTVGSGNRRLGGMAIADPGAGVVRSRCGSAAIAVHFAGISLNRHSMIGIKMLHGETRSLEIGNTFRIAANVLRFRQGYFCQSRHDNCRLIKPITSRPSSEVTNLSRRILVYQGEAPHMQEIEMPKDNDALSLLKSDHEDVKKLFKELEAEEDQEAIFNQIKGALEVHAAIEEEIFYPAVKKARSEEVKEEVREAYEEHKQVKALLAAIAEISPDDESYSAKLKLLKEDVEHHVKEEEGEMFPDARKYLRDKLEDLGAQMQARKDELETNGVPESKHEATGKRGGRSSNGKSKEA